MKSLSETYVISSFVDMLEYGHVNLNHFLQRESGQWSLRQKIKLIDTLLRGYPFPTIYAIKESDDSNDLTILDGKQRITTLKSFFIDESFAYRCKEPVVIDGTKYELDRMKYSDMPKEVQRKLGGANFNVVTFTGYSMEDVLEIFDRLNNGTPLTKAEKSKPLMGDQMIAHMKDIISSGFFEKTGMTETQKRKGECYTVLIQCLMLMNGEATSLSSSAITRFIENNRDSIVNSDYDKLSSLLSKFGEIIDGIEFISGKNPISKLSIPPIVAVLSKASDAECEVFAAKLKSFFEGYGEQEEYHALCEKSTDKAQVGKRMQFFEDMMPHVDEQ